MQAFTKNPIFVSGLPRSGSTLLCQLLGHHPGIYSTGHTSPLPQTLSKMRSMISDNNLFLSQLDVDFELGYQRLHNAMMGFVNGWFAETEKPFVVDKSRGWIAHVDLAKLLFPNFKMLICIREPSQIYGSVEARHQKTLLLDFPDHLASLTRYGRADKLFAKEGVIGGPLGSIQSLQDIDPSMEGQFYYVIYEHLMEDPHSVLNDIFGWLGASEHNVDLNNLTVKPHESDSYYRFKYSHATRNSLSAATRHIIPPRIEAEIKKNFQWFYQTFYPGLL